MKLRSTIVIAVGMVLVTGPCQAQNDLHPFYDSLFQVSQSLIQGKEHYGSYPQGNGHPFFGQPSWRNGLITIHKMSLPHPAIRYDLLNDHLLIQHFSESGSHVIIVNTDFAGEFQLDGHQFCFLEALDGGDLDLEPGYYEAAYCSGSEIWIKWKKSYSEGSQGSGQYEQSRTLYLKSRNNYFRITNRKSLLRAFPGREEEIKAYLKEQKISVRLAEPEQIIGVASYIDGQLK